MKKWIFVSFLVGIVGLLGYSMHSLYRAGYLSIPDLPDGAYPISFSTGFRAILVDADVIPKRMYTMDDPKYFRRLSAANPDRKYLGLPLDVAPWFEVAWSWCEAPTEEDRTEFSRLPPDLRRIFETARFDGVCRIDVDGEQIVRGLLFSVPRM